ncbi:hypothetical protein DSAG12_01292 [Promethearchaeum syntrophicum]|uniref:Uncharacterized protein n=1 Tax=Promethearchaeum syntrophicum TaxID=2594042 RepID=A0A5B9DA66_9ARCH|nr:hypothetical protein [Candidatus Prometheoarchaeum syntrophicum]QEE15466.1 hypothetical protein DSAG12_01292 [Candidatus Prometheoarchaeum syntrophicum]
MVDIKPDIEKIFMHFIHKNQQYLVFSLKSDPYTYLYLKNDMENIVSLLYGEEIYPKVQSLLYENSTICIECELGTLIVGGISYDSPDLVEFNLTKSRANQILKELKKNVEKLKYKIEVVGFK